ncbi:MAG: ribosome biogenesis GTPase Der [Clostridia bacterium]|nr:ribosome biogenesis GTPase Der [Clostridia bacterium]
MSKPCVAIVGRPNVGKSTLFNRLTGGRTAIVEDTPGITRDRIYKDAEWCGKVFTLIDTGGIEPKSYDIILSQMKRQADLAIEQADVIIFMVDVKTSMTASDAEVAAILQKSGKPVVLAVNKSDSPGNPPMEFYEFYNLGIGEPIAVSSTHGMGLGELLDEVCSYFDESDFDESSEEDVIRVAVTGKPNAGKSTLFNHLLGEERVIVSNIPGTTRDAIDSYLEKDGQKYIIVDTAGMRKRGKIDDNVERYSVVRSLNAIEKSDVSILMIDASEGISEQDSKIAGYAHDNGRASIIAVNKWDLIEKDDKTMSEFKKSIEEKLPFMNYAPQVYISAKTGQRTEKLLETVKFVHKAHNTHISTGALNDIINEAVNKNQAPSDKGKRLKIYYATQASTAPPTFVLFVNDKELFHFSYLRYIENQIRTAFDLTGTPVKFILRERNEDEKK